MIALPGSYCVVPATSVLGIVPQAAHVHDSSGVTLPAPLALPAVPAPPRLVPLAPAPPLAGSPTSSGPLGSVSAGEAPSHPSATKRSPTKPSFLPTWKG